MKISGPAALPEVRDAGPAAVRRDTSDPAAAGFAAAARLSEQGGEAIAKGLSDFAAGIDRLAEDRDRAKATEALNEYMNRSSALLYDPASGLMLASGAGAEGLASRAYKGHLDLRGEIGGRLSGRQRRMFAEAIAPYDRNVGANAMRREGELMAEYRRDQGLLGVKNSAALFANDPDAFSIEAQEELVSQYTVAIFGDQGAEANVENSRKVRQMLISQMAISIAAKDPLKAEEFLAREGDALDPAAREALAAEVEKAALPVKAQAEAQGLLAKYGADGLASALSEVRESHSGRDEDVYLRYVNSLFADARAARNEREAARFDEIVGLIRQGARVDKIDEAIRAVPWSKMSTVYQLEDMRDRHFRRGAWAPGGSGAGRIKSDPAAIYELTDLRAAGKLVDAFPTWESFREVYEKRLAPSKYEEYYNLWHEASGRKRGRESTRIHVRANETVDFFVKKSRIREEAKVALLKDEVNRSLDAHRAKHGAEPTFSEVYQIVEGLCQKVALEDGSWGGVKAYRFEINTPDAEGTAVVDGQLWRKDVNSPSGWSRYRAPAK